MTTRGWKQRRGSSGKEEDARRFFFFFVIFALRLKTPPRAIDTVRASTSLSHTHTHTPSPPLPSLNKQTNKKSPASAFAADSGPAPAPSKSRRASSGAPSPATLDGSASSSPSPAPAPKRERPPAPLFNYFALANHSTFSTTWLAIKAAHLDEYLNRTDLSITFFAPTNAAWEKRLPSITRDLGLDVKGLFSEGKSQILNEILKYHMLSVRMDFDRLSSQSKVTTTANLCSDAKDLEIAEGGAGNGPDSSGKGRIALLTSGDGYATLLDRGVKVNKSIVYAIDDVLLPSAVTVPTMQALGQKDMLKVSAEVWADKDLIDHLAAVASGGAAAPAAQPLPSEFRRHRSSSSSGSSRSSSSSGSSSSSSGSSSKNKKKRNGDSNDDGGDFDDGAPVSVRSADNGADDTSSDSTGN